MPSTVAGTDPGNANQARDLLGRHGARVADDDLCPFEVTCFLGRTDQHRDIVPSRYRLADDQAAGAAGRAEDQDLRFGSPDAAGHGILHDRDFEKAGRLARGSPLVDVDINGQSRPSASNSRVRFSVDSRAAL